MVHRVRGLVVRTSEQLGVALLLLPGPALETCDVAPPDQLVDGELQLVEVGEAVQALAARLELARGLRSAEHQDGEQREFVAADPEGFVEEVPVLRGPGPLPAGQS